MSQTHTVLYKGGQGEVEEKKSKFISHVFPIETEESVSEILSSLKKQYWDARHHCYAFSLGDHNEILRSSDDGEPSGTAGKPILDVITSQEIHNCLIVVIRYFGGTLLGTGGLVRCYRQAALDGLNHSVCVEKLDGALYTITTDYTDIGKLQYYLGEHQIPVLDSNYTDTVTLQIPLSVQEADAQLTQLTELTSGRIQVEKQEEISFGFLNHSFLLL